MESENSDDDLEGSVSLPDLSLTAENLDSSDEPDDAHSGSLESDSSGESTAMNNCLDEDWISWAVAVRKLRGFPITFHMCIGKCVVGTGCSGTDAPVHSVMFAIGAENVEHAFACDNWQPSKDFICCNFNPQHFYSDIGALNQVNGSPCSCCGMTNCKAIFEELDMFIMGFPLYSILCVEHPAVAGRL